MSEFKCTSVQEDATRNVRVKCAHVGKRSTQVCTNSPCHSGFSLTHIVERVFDLGAALRRGSPHRCSRTFRWSRHRPFKHRNTGDSNAKCTRNSTCNVPARSASRHETCTGQDNAHGDVRKNAKPNSGYIHVPDNNRCCKHSCVLLSRNHKPVPANCAQPVLPRPKSFG